MVHGCYQCFNDAHDPGLMMITSFGHRVLTYAVRRGRLLWISLTPSTPWSYQPATGAQQQGPWILSLDNEWWGSLCASMQTAWLRGGPRLRWQALAQRRWECKVWCPYEKRKVSLFSLAVRLKENRFPRCGLKHHSYKKNRPKMMLEAALRASRSDQANTDAPVPTHWGPTHLVQIGPLTQ